MIRSKQCWPLCYPDASICKQDPVMGTTILRLQGYVADLSLQHLQMSQCTKPTIRLVRPAKTQTACASTVWSESLLIACAFYSLWAIQRGTNENPCHTWGMFRPICHCWSHRSYCRFCRVLAQMLKDPFSHYVNKIWAIQQTIIWNVNKVSGTLHNLQNAPCEWIHMKDSVNIF